MFRRILVPLDFSLKNRRAVAAAAQAAAPSDGEVTLLHVIERVDAGAPGAFRIFYAKLEAAAKRKLNDFLEPLEKKRLRARSVIVYGNRVNEILRYAGENRSDLIVMSSHRLSVKNPAENWGTISYKVGVLSRCPVLLVK